MQHRPPPYETPKWQRRGRRQRRLYLVLGLSLALLVSLVAGSFLLVSERLGNNVARVPDVFSGLGLGRPASTSALTFLLVGTDSRDPDPTTGSLATGPDFVPGAQRSDVLMLAQLNPDGTGASVVSIPRDSWVDIPGRGMDKLNAAYSLGGSALLVGTVERLTNVHVDHFAVIDFAGFRTAVDALGGIDVDVAAPTTSAGVEFREGVNHLDGTQALVYVRQRHDLPAGDLDRSRRQQNVLRALLTRLAADDTLTSPVRLFDFLDAMSRSVSVDDTLSNDGLRSLAVRLRDLRPAEVTFLNAPVGAAGKEAKQDVLYLDPGRATELWDALRNGSTAAYRQKYPADLLGAAPS